jgi:nucleotide-binding universal stress UspA family protein
MTTPKNKIILVPTDFTEAADSALNHALRIARTGSDKVVLLHVINSDTKSRLKKEGGSEDSLKQDLQAQLSRVGNPHKVPTESILREGSIFSVIGDVAEEIGARLIVIGTHGVQGLQHITGAYVLRVASTSPVPVVIVQKKGIREHGYKKIVIPVSFPVESKQTVIQGMHMAELFGAEVQLFVSHSNDEFVSNSIKLNLGYAKRLLDENNIRYTETSEVPKSESYSKQLLKSASSTDNDLIVIVNERGKDLKDFIIGPENEKIINNDAQIPVMVLNPLDTLWYYSSALVNYGSPHRLA